MKYEVVRTPFWRGHISSPKTNFALLGFFLINSQKFTLIYSINLGFHLIMFYHPPLVAINEEYHSLIRISTAWYRILKNIGEYVTKNQRSFHMMPLFHGLINVNLNVLININKICVM